MISFALAFLALTTAPDGQAGGRSSAAVATQSPVAETAATKVAADFLALLDAGNWPASYAATTGSFQALNTVQVWQSASEQARVPLGRVRTDFANKPGATETLSLDREGDSWKVAGVYIE